MKSKLIAILAVFILCGCVGVDPNSLQKVAIEETLVLKQPFIWQHHFSMAQNTDEYTLIAGEYTSRLQDSVGTYYEGPGYCWQRGRTAIRNKPVVGTIVAYKCGIFIPAAPNASLKVYHFLEENVIRWGDDANPEAKARATKPNTSDSTVPIVVNTVAGTNATALQGGIGGGIAAGIIGAVEEAKKKNMQFDDFQQPANEALRAALTKKESN
jgi:hypothetical protein